MKDFFSMGSAQQKGEPFDSLNVLINDYKQVVSLQKASGEFNDRVLALGQPMNEQD